jgi:hypothetical protein
MTPTASQRSSGILTPNSQEQVVRVGRKERSDSREQRMLEKSSNKK